MGLGIGVGVSPCFGGRVPPWAALLAEAKIVQDYATLGAPASSISSWANGGTLGNAFVQATGSKQPTVDGGAKFDDVDDGLTYSGTKSDVRFLHDGTGGTVVLRCVFTAAGDVIDNLRAGAVGRVGFEIQQNGSNIIWYVANGVARCVDVSVAYSATATITCRMSTASGYDLRVNGTSLASGALAAVPDTGDAWGVLTLGEYTATGNNMGGTIKRIAAIARHCSDGEVAALEAWAAS